MKPHKSLDWVVGILAIMLTHAIVLLVLAVSSEAHAAPIAVTEYGDTTVVLTDNVDESICPLGTHIAIAKAGQQTIIGCWTVDERDVKILWLAPHVLPKSVFEAVEPDTKA